MTEPLKIEISAPHRAPKPEVLEAFYEVLEGNLEVREAYLFDLRMGDAAKPSLTLALVLDPSNNEPTDEWFEALGAELSRILNGELDLMVADSDWERDLKLHVPVFYERE